MFELEISAPNQGGDEAEPEGLQRIDATFGSFRDFVAHAGSRLSPSRLFLETEETLAAGTAVRLEIALESGATVIRALGQVAAGETSEESGGDRPADRPPGLDLRFTYVDPASARVIDSVSRLARRESTAAALEAAPLEAAGADGFSGPAPEDGAPCPRELPALDVLASGSAEPEEKSWELEVDSLLSEVLPATGEAPPAAAGEAPADQAPTDEAPAAELDAVPASGWGTAGETEDLAPATAGGRGDAMLDDLPLRAAAGGATAEERPPSRVRVEGAELDDSLVLGFGESITMTPPDRRSALRPLLLVFVGLAALGAFLYFRGPASRGPASRGPASQGPGTGAAASATVAQPPPTAEAPPATPAAEAPPPPTAEAPPATPAAEAPPPAAAEAPAATPAAAAEVQRAVETWAAAWSSQRVDAYLACYGPQYSPPGLGRREWEEQRRVRIRAPARIEVEVSDFSIEILDPSRARARFLQRYTTESRNLRARKVMELERRPEGWKIVKEQVDRG